MFKTRAVVATTKSVCHRPSASEDRAKMFWVCILALFVIVHPSTGGYIVLDMRCRTNPNSSFKVYSDPWHNIAVTRSILRHLKYLSSPLKINVFESLLADLRLDEWALMLECTSKVFSSCTVRLQPRPEAWNPSGIKTARRSPAFMPTTTTKSSSSMTRFLRVLKERRNPPEHRIGTHSKETKGLRSTRILVSDPVNRRLFVFEKNKNVHWTIERSEKQTVNAIEYCRTDKRVYWISDFRLTMNSLEKNPSFKCYKIKKRQTQERVLQMKCDHRSRDMFFSTPSAIYKVRKVNLPWVKIVSTVVTSMALHPQQGLLYWTGSPRVNVATLFKKYYKGSSVSGENFVNNFRMFNGEFDAGPCRNIVGDCFINCNGQPRRFNSRKRHGTAITRTPCVSVGFDRNLCAYVALKNGTVLIYSQKGTDIPEEVVYLSDNDKELEHGNVQVWWEDDKY